jgi:anti-anti-sigma factor
MASTKETMMMSEFANTETLRIHIGDDRSITVGGEIDMAGGPALDAAIQKCEGDGPLVIDLADVSFIDSSGLRSLLEASRRATIRGTVVHLRHVGPEVARLLDITGTTDQFQVTPR